MRLRTSDLPWMGVVPADAFVVVGSRTDWLQDLLAWQLLQCDSLQSIDSYGAPSCRYQG